MKQALRNTAVLVVALASTFYVLTQLLILAADHGPLPFTVGLAALAGLAAYAAVVLPVAFYRAVRHEDGGK
jgi:hypothetical protein